MFFDFDSNQISYPDASKLGGKLYLLDFFVTKISLANISFTVQVKKHWFCATYPLTLKTSKLRSTVACRFGLFQFIFCSVLFQNYFEKCIVYSNVWQTSVRLCTGF